MSRGICRIMTWISKKGFFVYLLLFLLNACQSVPATTPTQTSALEISVTAHVNKPDEVKPTITTKIDENILPTHTKTQPAAITTEPTQTPESTTTPLPRLLFDSEGTIAYVSNPGASTDVMEIFLMNADDRSSQQLTDMGTLISAPSWSPDGSRLIFMARPDFDSTHDIFIVEVGTGRVQQLTNDLADDQYPDWSPDGKKIVFNSDRDGDHELYTMDANGGGIQPLTENEWNDTNPDWAPNSEQIAFESDQFRNSQIFTLAYVDLSNEVTENLVKRITSNEFNDYAPAWSPDGNFLAFHSVRSGPPEIYIMDSNGGNQKQITFLKRNAWWADWSPDGQWILFSFFNNRDEFTALHELYVVNVQGSLPVRLTNSPKDDWYPAWKPLGTN